MAIGSAPDETRFLHDSATDISAPSFGSDLQNIGLQSQVILMALSVL